MATFEMDMPDDFLSELELTDELATEMIDAALPILQKSIQNKLESKGHRKSGDLIDSVKVKKAKKARNGAHIGNVVFSGKDRNGVPNALKAGVIENGKSNQNAQPFMQAASNDAEEEALNTMQDVYNQRMVGK